MELTPQHHELLTKHNIPIPTNLIIRDYHYRNFFDGLEDILTFVQDNQQDYMETVGDLDELKKAIEDHNAKRSEDPKGFHITDLEKLLALHSVMHICWHAQLMGPEELKNEYTDQLAKKYNNLMRTMKVWAWG